MEEKKAPIIEDGKTLDELLTSPFERALAKAARAEGATDEEIWASLWEL